MSGVTTGYAKLVEQAESEIASVLSADGCPR
jgi:hypothetical protein